MFLLLLCLKDWFLGSRNQTSNLYLSIYLSLPLSIYVHIYIYIYIYIYMHMSDICKEIEEGICRNILDMCLL